jgi:hypothetical protein
MCLRGSSVFDVARIVRQKDPGIRAVRTTSLLAAWRHAG